ncbi:sulfotransferase family 2 domain-containing protein [Candidatus Aquiluna sp. IMCC13023]|uniref:sulfotransferase family 2 domain-containing protein n=1 Tax=Candidatus Aquiluna sp. IMCC13023 TaxID=1081644 RepID=UPI0006816FD9|nr:sulfotransferase family 2 domain-containing protein [Candidatus Aquiluna sp. IMCC13023]
MWALRTVATSIPIHRLALEIFVSPKVLSTSLKQLAFEIDFDQEFEPSLFPNSKIVHIHDLYPTKSFPGVPRTATYSTSGFVPDLVDRMAQLYRNQVIRKNEKKLAQWSGANQWRKVPRAQYLKIGFVRDPLERLASVYRNRVIRKHDKELAQWSMVSQLGIDPNPSFEHFVENLTAYQKALPTIMHHSAPQITYLGLGAQFYDHLYLDKESQDFELYLTKLLGRPTTLTRSQTSDRNIPLGINSKVIERVREIYRLDYEVFGEVLSRKTHQTPPNR